MFDTTTPPTHHAFHVRTMTLIVLRASIPVNWKSVKRGSIKTATASQ